jgi:alcohol dehydrogenase class IV
MTRFEFATATRVIFGPGAVAEVGPLATEMGRRALLVGGAAGDHAARLADRLRASGLAATRLVVRGEPEVGDVLAGVAQARQAGCDLVIAIGGGSAIDTGKAIAAMLTNPGEPTDYLEVIGQGRPLLEKPAPFVAIPTTAGTGAEVTRNAVLTSPEHRLKVSLRSPAMLPRLAVVDPELTYSMPPAITASTGLDALTQLIEPFVSNAANPLTDALCREGMARAAGALRRAYDDGADQAARQEMALASLLGGLALANARLGAVHGFAGVLGGMFGGPHGVICARLLPPVMAVNLRALRQRQPAGPALARYDEVARIVTGRAAEAETGVEWVTELVAALNIPSLAAYGVTAADFPIIVTHSRAASSMKGNPITLTDAELTEILERAV